MLTKYLKKYVLLPVTADEVPGEKFLSVAVDKFIHFATAEEIFILLDSN